MRYTVQSGLIDYNPAQDIAGTVPTKKTQHRPALDFERIPELLARIDDYNGRPLTKLAVELSLLIFIRSSELRFGRWNELDFDRAISTIPAEREAIKGVKFAHRGAKIPTPSPADLSLAKDHAEAANHQLAGILFLTLGTAPPPHGLIVGAHDSQKFWTAGIVNHRNCHANELIE